MIFSLTSMICTQDPEVDQMSTRSTPKYASQKAYMAKGSPGVSGHKLVVVDPNQTESANS
jgi:hypothetical protein